MLAHFDGSNSLFTERFEVWNMDYRDCFFFHSKSDDKD